MEGIPPEDMKEHEKQKSGIKIYYVNIVFKPSLWIMYVHFLLLLCLGH